MKTKLLISLLISVFIGCTALFSQSPPCEFFINSAFCPDCENDGLQYGVNAFATVEEALGSTSYGSCNYPLLHIDGEQSRLIPAGNYYSIIIKCPVHFNEGDAIMTEFLEINHEVIIETNPIIEIKQKISLNNGIIQLGAGNIILHHDCEIVYDVNKYINTNGTGMVEIHKNPASVMFFPVGAISAFSPVDIGNVNEGEIFAIRSDNEPIWPDTGTSSSVDEPSMYHFQWILEYIKGNPHPVTLKFIYPHAMLAEGLSLSNIELFYKKEAETEWVLLDAAGTQPWTNNPDYFVSTAGGFNIAPGDRYIFRVSTSDSIYINGSNGGFNMGWFFSTTLGIIIFIAAILILILILYILFKPKNNKKIEK